MKRGLLYGLIGLGLCGATVFFAIQWQHIRKWPTHCADMKAQLSQSPQAKLVFSPIPSTITPSSHFWPLHWNGITIAIPPLPYRYISISGPTHSVFLATDQKDLVMVSYTASSTQHDMPLIARLWSESASLMDVMRYGYQHTPADLTCTTDDINEQAKLAAALTLKAIASPYTPLSVHSLPALNGWVVLGKTTSGKQTQNYRWQQTEKKLAVQLTYRLPTQQTKQLYLPNPHIKPTAAAPHWAAQLQAWLNAPTPAHLCQLTHSLQLAGFDADNIQKLQNGKCNAAAPSAQGKVG